MGSRVVAIIQGRMASTRLPGKILADISGKPMLARVHARTARCALVQDVIVATTTDSSDDPVADYCAQNGIPCFRGSQYDVLDRYHAAATVTGADVIIRITADCPVIDPLLIDQVAAAVLDDGYDFACNRLPPPWRRSFPVGLDVEACTVAALGRAWSEAGEPHHREHVMPYLYEGVELQLESSVREVGVSPHGFRVALLHHTQDLGSQRWTVDVPEDLEFIRQVFAHFKGRDDFTWLDVLALLRAEPALVRINAGVRHNTLQNIDPRALD